jgi:hypothetical protein
MKRPPDMSHAAFKAALLRNGFRGPVVAWFEDTTGATPGVSYSGVFTSKGKLLRRTTIAHLIRRRHHQVTINESKGVAP